MKKNYIWFSTFLTLILAGCASINGFPDRSVDSQLELKSLQAYLSSSAITAFNSPNDSDRNNLSKTAWRNEVIEARIRADAINFQEFEKSLYSQGIGFGVGTDWITLALNGAGAVSGGTAASALAAAAAGVVGARGSYEKNALYDKTLPTLMAQMVANRKVVLVTIREGESLDAGAYPLTRALTDLEDYYSAGTIPGSLTNIAENAGAQAKEADKTLNSLLIVKQVTQNIQIRREKMAAFIKGDPTRGVAGLSPADLDTLAVALGKQPGSKALPDILSAIAASQTDTSIEAIAQKIKVIFGQSF